ncbi:MAG: VWA domain-containing protein [Saprospiraceae bacterium]
MTFAQPLWLLLFLLAPLLWYRAGRDGNLRAVFSQFSPAELAPTWRARWRRRLPWLRWTALTLLALAMARPQRQWQEQKIKADALDIILSMDVSLSMLNRDFNPNRLAVAKAVAANFVENRPYDRIGLVAFDGEAFTLCPLTSDRRVVKEYIQTLQIGRVGEGTAIGLGLATAVNRLKNSASKSRIVILLTDGVNNAGFMAPMDAAEIARSLGVKVYTVGVGTEGDVLAPSARNGDGTYYYDFQKQTFDPKPLEDIAALTGGKFYRAQSAKALDDIYKEIDRLEKTKVDVTTVRRTSDYYHWFVGAAILLLLLEALLRWGFLRSVTA